MDLEELEAKALGELHEVLYDQRLLDKLLDMVTFMNWERDSSCTVDMFKSLLFDSMKLKRESLDDSRLDLLLQRYRQDSYELAKTQREELKELDSDRLEVIQKGFKLAGK